VYLKRVAASQMNCSWLEEKQKQGLGQLNCKNYSIKLPISCRNEFDRALKAICIKEPIYLLKRVQLI
jgi:hypothetical protein